MMRQAVHRKPIDDDEEQAALIEEIIQSRWFQGAGAEIRIKLLKLLFNRKHEKEGIKALAIGGEILPPHPGVRVNAAEPSIEDEARAQEQDLKVADAARHHCEALRSKLIQYNRQFSAGQKWRCELPRTSANAGYKLSFVNQEDHPRVTLGFWWAHLKTSMDVTVVYNATVFYRDRSKDMVFRFGNINADETDNDLALKTLETNHPEMYNKEVYVDHLYLSRGEIEARDQLQDWFQSAANVSITKSNSDSIKPLEIYESVPILLGNIRTNKFMRDILKDVGQDLQIQVSPDQFGAVVLHSPTPEELQRINMRKPSLVFQLEGERLYLPDQPLQKRDHGIFAVVTRIPNPSGEGPITIIWSDYTRCFGQIARTLTQDDRLTEILKQVGWPLNRRAPSSFQVLFLVPLRGVQVAKPEFLALRIY